MKNKYYVYRHIRLDNNLPFYIGKGINKRAYIKTNRNKYWYNIVKSVGYRVEVVMKDLSEAQALRCEKKLIKLYKSYNLNLSNITEGGEATYRRTARLSQEHKDKIGRANLGRKHSKAFKEGCRKRNSGKKLSQEHKDKIGLALKNRPGRKWSEEEKIKFSKKKKGREGSRKKEVVDTITGSTYSSARIAAQILNINHSTLIGWLSGHRKNKTNLKYKE